MEEKRKARIIVNRAGGTAGENSLRFRVTLPVSWIKQMGISKEAPLMELPLDGDAILMKKKESVAAPDFVKAAKGTGHMVKEYRFYHASELCSIIYADFTAKQVVVQNSAKEIIHTAFGNNNQPTWEDFLAFLEERCVPRSRVGIAHILQAMGLEEYDPVKIVEQTKGRMAEDKQWLSITEV